MAADNMSAEEREPPRLRRRWFVNLALLVVVLALVAFYFYHRTQEKAETGPALTTIAAAQVARVRIERPGLPAIALEKHGDAWRLAAPFRARANRHAVENVLRVAAARRARELGGAPRQYGLEPPQAVLRLDDEPIEIGALHPFQQQVYVRYRGAVHLVPATALAAVARAPAHFVDGQLIETDRRLVGLRLPGFTLTLKDGAWRRQPPAANLTSDQLGDFVAQWTNARALAVEPAGNRPALATIRLTRMRAGAGPETLMLEVLAHKPTFVLRRRDENLEYHFPEEIGKRMLEIGEK